METSSWNEEEFVRHLAHRFSVRGPELGIGDDCAVIPMSGSLERGWLVTTDALVEEVHFLRKQIPPRELGYKTVAVNVSDIAAMGATPRYGFLSIALPGTIECSWLEQVVEGIEEGCRKWNLSLLGGDTIGSKRDLFVNLTLIGEAQLSQIKYRHGAKLGDLICVTGFLGDSGGGLQALQKRLPSCPEVDRLIHAHFHPEPSPAEGIWLASQEGVHAMMDLSDGLDTDLKRLLKLSAGGAIVHLDHLPISKSLSTVSQRENWNLFSLALTGGEDYCLLLTISQKAWDSLHQPFQETFGHPLCAIGQVTAPPTEISYQRGGKPLELSLHSFEHFALPRVPQKFT